MVEKSRFVTDIERLLELKAGTVSSTDTLESIGWDSLAVVSFIAHVDSKYGLSVAPEKIEQAKTVDDLFAAINT